MLTTARRCRFTETCVPATLKQLIACRTQHHAELPLDAIAERAGVRRDRLYTWGNDNQPELPSIDRFLRLCEVVGWDLLDFALRPFGRISVALPRARPGHRDPLTEAADVAIAGADALHAVRDAIPHGVSPLDRQRILAALDTLEREAADLREAIADPHDVALRASLERVR